MKFLSINLLFIITLGLTLSSCGEEVDYDALDEEFVSNGKEEMGRLVREYTETEEGQQFFALYETIGSLVDTSKYDRLGLPDTITEAIYFSATNDNYQNAVMVFQDFREVPVEYDYKKMFFSGELEFRKVGESVTTETVACDTYEPEEFKLEWDYQLKDAAGMSNCEYLFILREKEYGQSEVLSDSKFTGGEFVGELLIYSISRRKLLNVLPVDAMNSEILTYESNGSSDNFEKIAHGDLINKINATIQMQLELNFNISGNIPYLKYRVFDFKARQY